MLISCFSSSESSSTFQICQVLDFISAIFEYGRMAKKQICRAYKKTHYGKTKFFVRDIRSPLKRRSRSQKGTWCLSRPSFNLERRTNRKNFRIYKMSYSAKIKFFVPDIGSPWKTKIYVQILRSTRYFTYISAIVEDVQMTQWTNF